jgi:hydroxyethylthiazole kinase
MPAEESEMPGLAAQAHDIAAQTLATLRARRPRVHCLTNTVAAAFTANVLLAAGAIPSMTISPEEVGSFVRGADALLVNLGTLDAERRAAVGGAVDAAEAAGRPWVLDPVLVDRSPPRAAFAADLVRRKPDILRANASETKTLFGEDFVRAARDHGFVIAATGRADTVTDGRRTVELASGHPLMDRVTAMGCAVSALVAACRAVEPDAFVAGVAALAIAGEAGRLAGAAAAGPGSFAVAFLDALYALESSGFAARVQVSA